MGRLIHCVDGQVRRWEAPVRCNGVVAPPWWHACVGNCMVRLVSSVYRMKNVMWRGNLTVDAKHHDCLHDLGAAVETDTSEVVVLAPPDGVVAVHVAHAIGV